MSWRHRSRRCALVDPGAVVAAGFPVGAATRRGRQVVLHRGLDGCWSVVDKTELADLPAAVQQRAISLAVAVVGGLDAVGRTVTSIEVDDELRWSGVWRARHRRSIHRCTANRDGGGSGC